MSEKNNRKEVRVSTRVHTRELDRAVCRKAAEIAKIPHPCKPQYYIEPTYRSRVYTDKSWVAKNWRRFSGEIIEH